MRSILSLLGAGFCTLACSTQPETPSAGSAGSSGNSGGAGGSGGTDASGGQAGTNTSTPAGSSGDSGRGGESPGDAGPDAPMPEGRALMVVGTIPLVGTDVEIRRALESRNLMVEEFRDDVLKNVVIEDHRIIVLSYSMLSTDLQDNVRDTEASVLVMEHNLLPHLGMTDEDDHGFEQDVAEISIIAQHPVLTAGFPLGDLTVYLGGGQGAQMFWGVPGEGALRLATMPGNPDRTAYFAYPAGARMADGEAPGKRVQFFFALDASPPVADLYLNDAGMTLLGAAIDWCLQ